MVETAVQLAHVTENLPEKLRGKDSTLSHSQTSVLDGQSLEDDILEVESDERVTAGKEEPIAQATPELKAAPIESGKTVEQTLATPVFSSTQKRGDEAAGDQRPAATSSSEESVVSTPPATVFAQPQENVSKPAKPMLWSALDTVAAPEDSGESDQSHVPPVLRGLRKCEACGFPISGGRVLCVECEEKKWRGQLKRPQPMPTGVVAESPRGPGRAERSVAAQSRASSMAVSAMAGAAAAKPASSPAVPASAESNRNVVAPEKEAAPSEAAASTLVQTAVPSFVFSGGLQDSPSWISANKYVIGVLVLLVATIAAFFLFR
jgi:hypothetical protein